MWLVNGKTRTKASKQKRWHFTTPDNLEADGRKSRWLWRAQRSGETDLSAGFRDVPMLMILALLVAKKEALPALEIGGECRGTSKLSRKERRKCAVRADRFLGIDWKVGLVV